MKWLLQFFTLTLVLAAVGWGVFYWQQQKSLEQPVVEAGENALSLWELEQLVSAYPEAGRAEYLEGIGRWVNEEALVQLAAQSGLDVDREVLWRMQRAQRKILIDAVQRKWAEELTDVPEGELLRYYQENSSEFRRDHDRWEVSYLVSETGREAWDLREAVHKGDYDKVRAEWHKKQAQPAETEALPLAKIPECLHEEVLKERIDRISVPIHCDEKYYMVLVRRKVPAGSPIPFKEVRADIEHRVRTQILQEQQNAAVEKWKRDNVVFTYMEHLPASLPSEKRVGYAHSMESMPTADTLASDSLVEMQE
jgi:hypothetical protein